MMNALEKQVESFKRTEQFSVKKSHFTVNASQFILS